MISESKVSTPGWARRLAEEEGVWHRTLSGLFSVGLCHLKMNLNSGALAELARTVKVLHLCCPLVLCRHLPCAGGVWVGSGGTCL